MADVQVRGGKEDTSVANERSPESELVSKQPAARASRDHPRVDRCIEQTERQSHLVTRGRP
jgi:hypothetical protein